MQSYEDSDQTARISEGMFSCVTAQFTLRKHAYSNILKILPPENRNFQIKIPDIFHTSAQNTDCGTR